MGTLCRGVRWLLSRADSRAFFGEITFLRLAVLREAHMNNGMSEKNKRNKCSPAHILTLTRYCPKNHEVVISHSTVKNYRVLYIEHVS